MKIRKSVIFIRKVSVYSFIFVNYYILFLINNSKINIFFHFRKHLNKNGLKFAKSNEFKILNKKSPSKSYFYFLPFMNLKFGNG